MSSGTSPITVLDQVFPYQICINLDRRPERWEQMQQKFTRQGIHSVIRFPALDGNTSTIPAHWDHSPGAYGCLQSHLAVVREARRLGMPSLLIFEDDVVFDDQFQTKFSEYIRQLPPDWDMLFFGALHKDEPIRISENVGRITQANSTYACVLKNTVYDAFIELNRNSNDVLDNNSLTLQERFNCYCFLPHLAWVEADHSDAQQKRVHHWYLRESLVLFGPQVDALLANTTIVFAYNNEHNASNLNFLLRYYEHYFAPHLAMIVVEQGIGPALDRSSLPLNCHHVFLNSSGSFSREKCFAAGIRQSDPRREYFILSDSDIYLETLDIRANLRMCEQYDCVTGFSEIIDLTRQDSQRLRSTNIPRGIKPAAATRQRSEHCGFFHRKAVELPLAFRQRSDFKVFQSPNSALRLTTD